jgi:hypothetical protein
METLPPTASTRLHVLYLVPAQIKKKYDNSYSNIWAGTRHKKPMEVLRSVRPFRSMCVYVLGSVIPFSVLKLAIIGNAPYHERFEVEWDPPVQCFLK